MGKSTISMVIFNSYVKLPEGTSILRWNQGTCQWFRCSRQVLPKSCMDYLQALVAHLKLMSWMWVILDSRCLGKFQKAAPIPNNYIKQCRDLTICWIQCWPKNYTILNPEKDHRRSHAFFTWPTPSWACCAARFSNIPSVRAKLIAATMTAYSN